MALRAIADITKRCLRHPRHAIRYSFEGCHQHEEDSSDSGCSSYVDTCESRISIVLAQSRGAANFGILARLQSSRLASRFYGGDARPGWTFFCALLVGDISLHYLLHRRVLDRPCPNPKAPENVTSSSLHKMTAERGRAGNASIRGSGLGLAQTSFWDVCES